jgi:hypothetical protein
VRAFAKDLAGTAFVAGIRQESGGILAKFCFKQFLCLTLDYMLRDIPAWSVDDRKKIGGERVHAKRRKYWGPAQITG